MFIIIESQSSLETAVAANSHQREPAVVPQLLTTPTQPRLPPPGPPDSPDDHDEPAPVPDGYVSRSGGPSSGCAGCWPWHSSRARGAPAIPTTDTIKLFS
ncbi:hypothetical protein Pcinc_012771 [Petrolisthes cinctipes]|uniref:Uncharacterized protein n=1 Tax=Petrolisthes cinctipes TaxID=88211 RepID=A0AAE1G139_PETCI|nr:hypothetical protein Pcinc_012771 [Petrolisthes cinctipes]